MEKSFIIHAKSLIDRQIQNTGLVNMLKELKRAIKEVWNCVKKDYCGDLIWWSENEIVTSFYYHLRKWLENVRKWWLIPVAEYSLRTRHEKIDKREPRYPKCLNPPSKRWHIDLCILRFDKGDLRKLKRETTWQDPKFSYQYVNHVPIVAMEFEYGLRPKKDLRIKKPLERLNWLAECRDAWLLYYCFIGEKQHFRKIIEVMESEKGGLKHLKKRIDQDEFNIAHGDYSGKDWGIKSYNEFKKESEKKKWSSGPTGITEKQP